MQEFVTKEYLSAELGSFAAMVKRGFDDVIERIDTIFERKEFLEFKQATELSLYELKSDMGDVKGRLTSVENRLDRVEDRLSGIEDILGPTISRVDDHEDRISGLEMGAA